MVKQLKELTPMSSKDKKRKTTKEGGSARDLYFRKKQNSVQIDGSTTNLKQHF